MHSVFLGTGRISPVGLLKLTNLKKYVFIKQTEVWATFNDTDGVALVFLEDNRATDEQAADDAGTDCTRGTSVN